ncbi:PREDICTED: uncharacterized protein LOC106103624 isoform X2 [Papilio polytes]|nr:PREDICTED: uncharacterized protein LOC106103624 isoform X2 [Papilio polytes]
MAFNIVANLLVTMCVTITTATAWNIPDESVQLKSISSQIQNLKSLLNQPNRPSYKYNYGSLVPWDNNNMNSDYERYLRQQYILPILNSLSEVSEQIIKNIKDKTQRESVNIPYPMNYYPPRFNFGDIGDKSSTFNAPFGTVSGWGIASYGESQSQNSQNGGSSYSSDANPLSIGSSSYGGFGSFTPITSESQGPFSGDSSGPPVIPSRFPSISNRRPADFDDNRNWGIVLDDKDDKALTTPKPHQECDCEEQNKNITSLAIKLKMRSAETSPGTCKAVILLCCVPGNNEERRKECFTEQGCPRSYSTGIACLPVVIQAVFKDIYGNI